MYFWRFGKWVSTPFLATRSALRREGGGTTIPVEQHSLCPCWSGPPRQPRRLRKITKARVTRSRCVATDRQVGSRPQLNRSQPGRDEHPGPPERSVAFTWPHLLKWSVSFTDSCSGFGGRARQFLSSSRTQNNINKHGFN